MNKPLKVVIIGGGTAGWMTAAAFAGTISPRQAEVVLVESDDIGTVGVGEATLPHIKEFNDRMGIDEAEFLRETNATFKLGIEFVDWGKLGNRYIHPFGAFGQPMGGVAFHHCWLRAKAAGFEGALDDFSYPIVAAKAHRFEFPSKDTSSVAAAYSYAYHFDAALYARFLRKFSEARGIRRIEGKIVDVTLRPENGHVASVTLEDTQIIEGDLFIDCSGFRGLLINQALKTPFEDWSAWLPCDRAFAVPCARSDDFTPYTRSTARAAGWQWRIPLQHRTGNGYVYASGFLSDDEAVKTLLDNLDGTPEADPRPIRFQAGRREKCWNRNVIAVGLASGFLEPLESTSIYLIQVAIINLIRLLPADARIDPVVEGEFNRLIDLEYDRIRDFLILHYHANSRDDSELWRYTRHMSVPESLTARIAQFKHRAQVPDYRDGLFAPPSWISVFFGQDVQPEAYDPLADNLEPSGLISRLEDYQARIRAQAMLMPDHDTFIRGFAPSVTRETAVAS